MYTRLDEFKHNDMRSEVERQAEKVRLIREAEGDRPGFLTRLISFLGASVGRRADTRHQPTLPVSHAQAR